MEDGKCRLNIFYHGQDNTNWIFGREIIKLITPTFDNDEARIGFNAKDYEEYKLWLLILIIVAAGLILIGFIVFLVWFFCKYGRECVSCFSCCCGKIKETFRRNNSDLNNSVIVKGESPVDAVVL